MRKLWGWTIRSVAVETVPKLCRRHIQLEYSQRGVQQMWGRHLLDLEDCRMLSLQRRQVCRQQREYGLQELRRGEAIGRQRWQLF